MSHTHLDHESIPPTEIGLTSAPARGFVWVQVALVLSSAFVAIALAVFVGASNGDVSREIAAGAMASPKARTEIAALVADDFRASAPILASMPGLDGLVADAMNSPIAEPELHGWIEHSVRARLGEDVGPLMIAPADLISSRNAVINLAIGAIPAVPVAATPSPVAAAAPAVLVVAALAAASAVASYLVVRRQAGRSSAAMSAGLGGLVGAGVLLVIRSVAPFDGELSSLATNAIITPSALSAVAGFSLLALVRGILVRIDV